MYEYSWGNNSVSFCRHRRRGRTGQPHLVSRKVVLHERERELRPRVSLAQNLLLFLPISLVLLLLHLLLLLFDLHLLLDHFESLFGLQEGITDKHLNVSTKVYKHKTVSLM